MTQRSALFPLFCSLAWLCGCQSDAESGPLGGAAGSASGGAAGTAVTAGGSSSGAGGAATPSGGNSSTSGGGGQATAGSNTGGVAMAGTSQGGQAGTGGAGGASGSGGSGDLPPLVECTNKPSIDRITDWTASGEGQTVPATGSILVKEGAGYVAKVQFVGTAWHVIPVYVANKFGVTADFSNAAGFTLTYSATKALHVQLRSKDPYWSGGQQWATDIPGTGGQKETHFFSFAADKWASIFDPPKLPWPDTLKAGMAMVFIGNTENTVVFYGMRFDGYTPPCP